MILFVCYNYIKCGERMFDLYIVEGVSIIIFITTLVRSIFTNQKKQFLLLISIALALFGSYTLIINNLFGVYDKLINIVNYIGIDQIYKYFGTAFLSNEMKGFYLFFLLFLFALVIFLIIFIITRIFMIPERMKYRRYSSYAAVRNVYWAAFLGIIKGLLFVYIYLMIIELTLPVTGIDLSNSYLYNFFTSFDIYVDYIRNFANANIANPFV